MFNHYK